MSLAQVGAHFSLWLQGLCHLCESHPGRTMQAGSVCLQYPPSCRISACAGCGVSRAWARACDILLEAHDAPSPEEDRCPSHAGEVEAEGTPLGQGTKLPAAEAGVGPPVASELQAASHILTTVGSLELLPHLTHRDGKELTSFAYVKPWQPTDGFKRMEFPPESRPPCRLGKPRRYW